LGAILAARWGQIGWFCLAILIVLACKEVLSLTVVAMGIWLLVFEKKHWCGAIAIFAGISWFLISTQVIREHPLLEDLQNLGSIRTDKIVCIPNYEPG
jgi:hypothetical protein